MDTGQPDGLTVVVIAGAGARGAYEAGALRKLLPRLSPHGLSSTILLGTSAGAINAALWAGRAADPDLARVGESVKDVWRQIHRRDVFRLNLNATVRLASHVCSDAVRAGGSTLYAALWSHLRAHAGHWPGPASRELERLLEACKPGSSRPVIDAILPCTSALRRAPDLLDTAPLLETARRSVDFEQLNHNVESGKLAGVGFVATSCPMDASGGRSRVFLHTRDGRVPSHTPGSSIDYIATPKLAAEHVLASAAIPGVFPAIHIEQPRQAAGWYTDGGVRLNAPFEPAIRLGATRIVVVTSHAVEYPTPKASLRPKRPSALDTAAQSLHSSMADGLIEDLRALARTNWMVEHQPSDTRGVRKPHGGEYRALEVYTFSPENGTLPSVAAAAAEAIIARSNADADTALLRFFAQLVQGDDGSNELLSYLLFDPLYFEGQFAAVEHDAKSRIRDWHAYA